MAGTATATAAAVAAAAMIPPVIYFFEEDLADAVRTALRRAAIAADVAYDGDTALARLGVNDYDAVVLDRDLPGMSGDEVCQAIAGQRLPTRVLMLTAARRLDQKVAGFELGADDYLTKPFELPELIARLRALARRPSEAAPPVLTAGDVDLDPFRVEVLRAGRRVPVTRKEFAVLHVLMSARGGTVSAEQLLEKAWDENADPAGFQKSATGGELGFYAARSYSLIRPPRMGRRLIRSCERSATGWSGRGGRSWRLRWGRRPL